MGKITIDRNTAILSSSEDRANWYRIADQLMEHVGSIKYIRVTQGRHEGAFRDNGQIHCLSFELTFQEVFLFETTLTVVVDAHGRFAWIPKGEGIPFKDIARMWPDRQTDLTKDSERLAQTLRIAFTEWTEMVAKRITNVGKTANNFASMPEAHFEPGRVAHL